MDDLKLVADAHAPERPPSPVTTAAARRRLLHETRHGRGRTLPPARMPRRRLALVAGLTAASLVAAGWGFVAWRNRPLYRPEPLAGIGGPAADFLLTAADGRSRHAADGRFFHVHSVIGNTAVVRSPYRPGVRYTVEYTQDAYELSAKRPGELGPTARGRPITRASWQGDTVSVRPATPADAAAWRADLRPDAGALGLPAPEPRRGPDGSEGAELDFGVDDARRLPADPARLRAWLLNYATKFDHRRLDDPDLYLFTHAPSLLAAMPVRDEVRVAIYRVLASLKGVRLVRATDASGRTARAVAMRQTTRKDGTVEWQLFIDPETGRLTADQGVVVTPGTGNAALRPGTRQYFEVVKRAEWTDAPARSLLPRDFWDPTWQPPDEPPGG
ncbi:hypothetical protein BTM25_35370 [Actinomadura rubteroloni]|uniref:CU044_5270 family protein n=1 Tax=Actinomadura rubteroloni TaxID=1926885 RepID=A0A2P4UIL1_9ACTN|nr:hypothetical protein [Actinomadura rubteroloni]POM24899.1 hypothetical protein BTM25_35370 [Actinomadura rubteroloni]